MVILKKDTGNTGFAELGVNNRRINARFFDSVNALTEIG
jgi:hypothetical protein